MSNFEPIKQKSSKNPWILNKTLHSKTRNVVVSDIPFVIREDGSKGCIWCGDKLKSQHHATRYCKDTEACMISVYRWAYPQSFESMFYLLVLQNYKCMECYFSYKDLFLEKKLISNDEILTPSTFQKNKKKIPKERAPEVDHIRAIVNGGTSLGLDNHQVLCYSCHKSKTKQDLQISNKI